MKGVKGTLKEKIAILRLKKGDTEAFGYLYDLYVDTIYRYIYFRVSDSSLAFDIAQEVFLQTWEQIVDGKEIKNISAFLYKVAYFKVVDHYRSKDRQAALLDSVDEQELPQKAGADSDAELMVMYRHLRKLTPEQQDIIIFKHIEGLRINEIAEIIEKEPTNVRVILHRAMEELKKHMHGEDTKKK